MNVTHTTTTLNPMGGKSTDASGGDADEALVVMASGEALPSTLGITEEEASQRYGSAATEYEPREFTVKFEWIDGSGTVVYRDEPTETRRVKWLNATVRKVTNHVRVKMIDESGGINRVSGFIRM